MLQLRFSINQVDFRKETIMFNRISLLLALVVALLLMPAGVALAQDASTTSDGHQFNLSELPPGIQKQAAVLLEELMAHHHAMHTMPGHTGDMMHMHMQDIKALIDRLPPGILLQVLKALLELDMHAMMHFHHAVADGLLDQPPGQVLNFVKSLAQ
jgi:non-ribosomal peptide synthetase component F